jgi:hypothetical protein
MSDFLIFVLASAMLYFFSLVPIEYAFSKSEKVKICLICLVIVVFSIVNGWLMYFNQNILPLDAVDKEWDRYVEYCRQEHISWSDLTFPEWLSLKASE